MFKDDAAVLLLIQGMIEDLPLRRLKKAVGAHRYKGAKKRLFRRVNGDGGESYRGLTQALFGCETENSEN